MRYAITAMLVIAGLGWVRDCVADVTAEIATYVARGSSTERRVYRCPSDAVPLYSVAPNPDPVNVAISPAVVDTIGALASIFNDVFPYAGGGHGVWIINRDNNEYHGIYNLFCHKASGLSPAPFQRTIQPGTTNFFALTCPSSQVPVGYVSDADGANLEERSRLYLLGPAQTPLNALADGDYPVASMALGLGFRNNTAGSLVLNGMALCTALPGARLAVASAPVDTRAPFEVFAGIPDGFDFVNNAFTVSGAARTHVVYWTARDGPFSWWEAQTGKTRATYAFSDGVVKGVYLSGTGIPPSFAKQLVVGRAVIGTLLVPSASPVPPPSIVPVVEFYHAGLDHYFITANKKEIADLDGGVHVGWRRTDESFSAYDVGSSGRIGRRPVCRAYGNPAAGLDSHFYSASSQECVATLENFGDDWLPEAPEVFEMELPDTTTGACAADRVPIYRLWNNRADSSHRFVKSLALRTQMIARGFISEGYGPDGVVFCALP